MLRLAAMVVHRASCMFCPPHTHAYIHTRLLIIPKGGVVLIAQGRQEVMKGRVGEEFTSACRLKSTSPRICRHGNWRGNRTYRPHHHPPATEPRSCSAVLNAHRHRWTKGTAAVWVVRKDLAANAPAGAAASDVKPATHGPDPCAHP